MNEDLIYNLLYKSGLLADGCWDKFDEYDKEALNKYTELLIRECVKAIMIKSKNSDDKVFSYQLEVLHDDLLNKFGIK